MLGIKELDKLKPQGVVLIEIETSFPYEALVRKMKDFNIVYADGPLELAKRIFGKEAISFRKFLNDLLDGNPIERPLVASLTSVYNMHRDYGLERPEDVFRVLAHMRLAYGDSIAVAILHFDAVPDRFGRFLEVQADVALRMHPMGSKAVAIVRRHPRPSLIGETIEFQVSRYEVPGARGEDKEGRRLGGTRGAIEKKKAQAERASRASQGAHGAQGLKRAGL